MPLILASASPRRAELLRLAAIAFMVEPAEVDETFAEGESAEAYVRRVAEAKARAVADRFPHRDVLAADTTVVVGGEVLGKPVDASDAERMLRKLAGRRHEVLTAVSLACGTSTPAPVVDTAVERTTVEFSALSGAEIAWYVASGEPMDKAGGYAVQGLASRFVTRIEGSYTNVVGLPVALVYRMLRRRGRIP